MECYILCFDSIRKKLGFKGQGRVGNVEGFIYDLPKDAELSTIKKNQENGLTNVCEKKNEMIYGIISYSIFRDDHLDNEIKSTVSLNI